jgi:hypothetical protein
MIKNENYTINGQVVHEKTRKGLPGLRVEAWDKDRITKDDYLGSAYTDEEGRFTLRFTSAQFSEWFFDQKPDLYFKVYDRDTLVKDTIDDVLWNVDKPEIEIVIAVDIPIEPGEEEEEEQEPPAPEPVDEHLFFGRLIDDQTKAPVVGYLVKGFDHEAGEEPLPLGHAFSNEQGLFALAFTTPKAGKMPESKRLRLIVNTPSGDQIHEEEIAAKTNSTEVVDIAVTLPEEAEPPSPTIGELSEELKLKIPDKLTRFLKKNKITTLADLRRTGGLSRMEGLPIDPDDPILVSLETHASMSAVSNNITANAVMVNKGYSSVHAIAQAPRSAFVTTAQPVIGDFKAAQTQVVARAQTQLANQIMTGIAANVVNGFQTGIIGDGVKIPEWIEQKCGCKDCESAVSPLAYLADLLEYAITHLDSAGADIDLGFLTTTFHQPFAKLPASCEEMDKRVCQVRICIEVLRSYLKVHPPTAARQNVLNKAEASYRLAAYTTLLDKLGVSFEEIRLARTAEADSRTALADRLGLTLSAPRPDHLDDLFLDPASGAITEARLESLFGLVDTTRNPLAAGPTPDLQTWKLEHLRNLWRQQDWPEDPFTNVTLPLIDPDVIAAGNLRKAQAGEAAFDLWQARRTWVDNTLAAFKADRETNDLDHILKQVLGDPLPDINTLYQNLNNGTDLENAVNTIKGFHQTTESFRRLMELKTKDDDPAQNLDNEEWDEVYAILTQARKEAEYPNWIAEEQAAALKLSPKVFVPSLAEPVLAKWLAGQEQRQSWVSTLNSRSSAPIIDSDLIDAADLRSPSAGDPAFDLWQARRTWITTRLNNRKTTREAAADELTGFNDIVESSLGVSMADLDAIVAEQKSGIEIEPRLTQLTIERAAFTYLLRIRKLLQEGAPVLDSEWEAVYSTLVQVEKRREFADWRDEEQAQNITLGPDFFRIPDPAPIQFPPLTPDPLPEWRATFADRRDWQDMLEARIEQEKNTITSLTTAVSEAEAIILPILRDALIMATNASGSTLDAKAKWVTDKLLIDAKASGCQITTRISQAINTLQGLLFSVRTRQLNDTYPNLDLDADDFDEEWEWIGSYATWRSAMFAYLYPENILIPSLRRWQTPAFRKLVEETGRNRRLNPEQACKAVREYTDYFRDIATLRVEASCQTRTRLMEEDCRSHAEQGWRCLFYMFARGAHTQTAYWSVYDPENGTGYAQFFWTAIPGMEGVIELIGAAPYEIEAEERFIFLFGRRSKSGTQQLIFTKYDIEQRKWDGEPQELELPDEASSFTAVVKQNIHENQPPHLAIRTPNGAIYERKLNRDGSDWEDIGSGDSNDSDSGDWMPTISHLLGRQYSQLCAMVEVASGEYYIVTRKSNGWIYYRLFGSRDDAQWRSIGNGQFRGAFSWPGTAHMYVFYGNGASTSYRAIKHSGTSVGSFNRSSIFSFNSWLETRTGVSLKHWVVADSTQYSGMTLYDFFRLNIANDPHRILIPGFQNLADSIIRDFYNRRVNLYFDHIQGQIESSDAWSEWRIADKMVRQFAGNRSLVALLRRAFAGTATAFASRSTSNERSATFSGMNGLQLIAPTSGNLQGKAAASSKQFAHRKSSGQIGVFRTTFTRNNDALSERTPNRIAPRITGPYDISEHYNEQELQLRKTQIASVFTENVSGPASNLEYIKEAYYFIPVYVALQLQRRSHFTEALDWFRTVYDYSMPKANRKIYYGLTKEENLTNSYERAEDWLLDPLNPHSIAATRINTYTRFTLLSIVRCFLDYADAEFTRDTAESVPRARILYMTALELLESEHLKLRLGFCSDLAGSLEIEIGDPKWERVWVGIKAELAVIKNPAQLELVANNIKAIWAGGGSIEERFTNIRAEITKAKAAQPPVKALEAVVLEKPQYLAQSHAVVQSAPVFAQAIEKTGQVVAQHYGNTVSMVTGVPIQTLEKRETELAWMREPVSYQAKAAAGNGGLALRNDYLEVTAKNPIAKSYVTKVAEYAIADPASAVKAAGRWISQYVPAPSFNFCIPTNPIIEALQLRAELNLYKIRTCRNIAGVERELDLYAAPTDTISGLPAIGAGGQLTLPGAVTFIPTPYRYSIIIERAKQLVSLAQQVEAAFLSTLEKRDAEFYNLMKARQDIRTTRAGIRLQDLRIKVAEGEVKISELQKDRAQIQADHYKNLLDQGINGLELANLGLLSVVSSMQMNVASLNFLAAALPSSVTIGFPPSVSFSPSGAVSSIASGIASIAASLSTTASIMATLASYERRAQEWEFQRTVALQDVKIGAQQVKISEDRLRVVGQERQIATIQAEHAEQTAEFLATKFTNVELYDWMADILEGVYGFFLQQATSMAQLATSQLAFERQELPPPFIQDDYWEVKEDAISGEGFGENPVDRRGLTGSARLLQDIYQLDQFAFETDQRKNQLTKNISLVSLAPTEFQQFKQTGVLNVATPMELFDRDFPGDYLRLIKRVRVSVIALIPAIDSIKATLTATGNSRVTIGGDIFQTVNVNRGTEVVALSSPRDATGLFELQPQLSEKLNPFEGMGVDTQWQFTLPKAANRFDFNSIADVIITMEYTSLSSFTYRQQVIQRLNNRIIAERPYSFRNQFADQWYDFNNPELTDTPMVVRFNTLEADFPPNVNNLEINHVVLYFVRADGMEIEVPVTHLRFTEKGRTGIIGGGATSIDGVISTRRGNASSWTSMIGKLPYGAWELSLNTNLPDGRAPRELFKKEELTDILFVITFSGNTPEWHA